MSSQKKTNGISLIAAERRRQMEELGWTPDHDDEHVCGELLTAAAAYMGFASPSLSICHQGRPISADHLDNLVKAGALLAAEIDRIQRVQFRAELLPKIETQKVTIFRVYDKNNNVVCESIKPATIINYLWGRDLEKYKLTKLVGTPIELKPDLVALEQEMCK